MFEAAYEAAKADAVARFPNEACGIVVGNQYIACENISPTPEEAFAIAEADYFAYMQAGTLQACIHSHPVKQLTEKSCPSEADMRSQMSMNVPFGVIDTDGTVVNDPYWWGDFRLDLPLIGAEFHHGVEDCYLPVRRFFWQRRGIKLAEIPRDNTWWATKEDGTQQNLYVDNFERLGFVRITLKEMRDGDVFLGKINSPVINHAGVYLDNKIDGKGLVLHHLPGRLARREPAGPWLNRAELIVRYNAN